MPIQIFLVIAFLLALGKVFFRYRSGELTWGGALLWSVLWISGGVIVLLPNSTSYFAKLLGVGRGTDVIVYLSLVLLFYILFRLTVDLERIKRQITLLTRKTSLTNPSIIKDIPLVKNSKNSS